MFIFTMLCAIVKIAFENISRGAWRGYHIISYLKTITSEKRGLAFGIPDSHKESVENCAFV